MEKLQEKKFVALVFILCLLIASSSISITVYAATHPSWTTTIETGSIIDTASYVIFKDGSTYFAKNGLTGAINYSGSAAATVIQNVFDTTPSSIVFRNGTYDLNGATVAATLPLKIVGENNEDTILSGGTLKIVGDAWNYGFSISDIGFSSVGSTIQLWLVESTEGIIHHVSFWKESFSPGIPAILLTNCSSIKVDANWFDGYNMQTIQIIGNPTPLLGSGTFNRITNNDFGSVAVAFPSFTKTSDVAAIYCAENLAGCNLVDNNIAYMNAQNVFFYADDESSNQIISNNRMSAGSGNFTISIHAGHNLVTNNWIGATPTYGRAIQLRTCSITNIMGNDFYGMDIAINGSITASIIAYNLFVVYNETVNPTTAINLFDSPANQIVGNYFHNVGSVPAVFFTDDAGSKENQVSGNFITNATGWVCTAQPSDVIRNNFCYITENQGTQTIPTSTSVTFNHGMDGTPLHVYCGFNVTGYGSWIWSATATQITITVNNTGTYHFAWRADMYSWNE